MKWIFGLLSLSILFSSCDNELVVTDEWKDIPIVWGLLNKSDTAHYIRVEKAFLDPTTSALDIARIPDSLYYENATVSLRRVSNGQTFMLTRVDGSLEGYPRDTGIFAQSPNYLYKILANVINLVVHETYELKIDRGDGKPPVTATTIILPKPVLRIPSPNANLAFKRGNEFIIRWDEMPNAGLFDVKMRFNYNEKNPDTGNQFIPKSFEWTVAKGVTAREVKMAGIDFFLMIESNIPQALQTTRLFSSVDITIWAGGKELYEFIRIAEANGGLTGTQDIPKYSNLMPEGFGIFTSRNVSYNTGFQLADVASDSLKNGSITRHLNFQ